jgi:DNA polymerase-3 subunit gamma/tau
MMATTQPEDIPQTIRSRCQHFSYRAMKFEDIMGQLRDIVTKENISADEDSLALLAEAGDGSMRDALSILDQAIASTSDRLTVESVRGLIGSAPAAALETVMQAVAESSSEKILVLVDELIGEGHSSTHFARQLVRFLRNVTVAKIAGKDSALLQISSDERARASRIADLFTEEDLTRHLQIMLRTHGELGYRQEQRFHLELGLLKMAHAQRLLPIEQLLSEAAGSAPAGRPGIRPEIVKNLAPAADGRRAEAVTSARSISVSPFAADSARKGNPKAEASGEAAAFAGGGARATQSTNVVIMGSSAPAIAELSLESNPQPGESVEARTEIRAETRAEADSDSLRDAVLNALSAQQMLVSILEGAEWTLNGSSLLAKVAASAAMIEMSFTADARRIAGAAASGQAGRPIRVQVEPGGTTQPSSGPRRAPLSASSGSARSRAEQDPIVQRMKEKFGADIRTVIDHREKG